MLLPTSSSTVSAEVTRVGPWICWPLTNQADWTCGCPQNGGSVGESPIGGEGTSSRL